MIITAPFNIQYLYPWLLSCMMLEMLVTLCPLIFLYNVIIICDLYAVKCCYLLGSPYHSAL